MIVREKQIQVNQSKDYFIYKILFSIRGDDYSWYKVKGKIINTNIIFYYIAILNSIYINKRIYIKY